MKVDDFKQMSVLIFSGLSLFLASCSSAPELSEEIVEEKVIGVNKDPVIIEQTQFQSESSYGPMVAEVKSGMGSGSEKLLAKLYDFNRDGRTDFIEVYDETSKYTKFYDFDHDGIVDFKK